MKNFHENLQVVFIELTNRCNLKCSYCSKKTKKKDFKDMQLSTLEKILKGLPKKDLTICPYLSGEPMLYPNLVEAIQMIKSYGYNRIRLHTNGTMFYEFDFNLMIESGLSHLLFSVDGVDAKDYKRLRNVDFKVVKQNILKYMEVNDNRIKIGLQNLIPFGKKLQINKDLKDIEDLFDEKIIEHPHSWLNTGKIPETTEIEHNYNPCFFLQYYMVISANGNYLPCCLCLNEEMILGNVNDLTPEQAWDEMEIMRQKQINNQTIELCKNCPRCLKNWF